MNIHKANAFPKRLRLRGYWITSLYEPFTFCCALWCCGSATEKQIRVSSKLKIYARVCRGCLYYLYICTLEATYIIPSYLSSTRPQKLDLVSKYWILFSFSLRLSIWLPNIEKWLCVWDCLFFAGDLSLFCRGPWVFAAFSKANCRYISSKHFTVLIVRSHTDGENPQIRNVCLPPSQQLHKVRLPHYKQIVHAQFNY